MPPCSWATLPYHASLLLGYPALPCPTPAWLPGLPCPTPAWLPGLPWATLPYTSLATLGYPAIHQPGYPVLGALPCPEWRSQPREAVADHGNLGHRFATMPDTAWLPCPVPCLVCTTLPSVLSVLPGTPPYTVRPSTRPDVDARVYDCGEKTSWAQTSSWAWVTLLSFTTLLRVVTVLRKILSGYSRARRGRTVKDWKDTG